MLWLDWIIVAILGYGLVTGWMNGFVRTLLNVVALGAAFVLSPVIRPFALEIVKLVVTAPAVLQGWFATVLSFLLIYVGLSIIGLVWTRFLAKGAIQQTDKVAGLIVGGLLSLLVVVVPLALILSVPVLAKAPVVQDTLQRSTMLPWLRPVAPVVQKIASSWLHPTAPALMQGPSAKPGQGPKTRPPGKG